MQKFLEHRIDDLQRKKIYY